MPLTDVGLEVRKSEYDKELKGINEGVAWIIQKGLCGFLISRRFVDSFDSAGVIRYKGDYSQCELLSVDTVPLTNAIQHSQGNDRVLTYVSVVDRSLFQ